MFSKKLAYNRCDHQGVLSNHYYFCELWVKVSLWDKTSYLLTHSSNGAISLSHHTHFLTFCWIEGGMVADGLDGPVAVGRVISFFKDNGWMLGDWLSGILSVLPGRRGKASKPGVGIGGGGTGNGGCGILTCSNARDSDITLFLSRNFQAVCFPLKLLMLFTSGCMHGVILFAWSRRDGPPT